MWITLTACFACFLIGGMRASALATVSAGKRSETKCGELLAAPEPRPVRRVSHISPAWCGAIQGDRRLKQVHQLQ
jgi:hypothetical protein